MPSHVWMAPAWQEIIWRAAPRSPAVMCPDIDPTKVVRAALQGAASVAGLLITTEAMVAEVPKKQGPAMPGGAGGASAAWTSNRLRTAKARARPGLLGKLTLPTAGLKRSDACRFSSVTTMSTRPSRC